MSGVRCQWYDDEGRSVLAEGCRFEGTTCTFIHPSDVRWRGAIRRNITRRGRGRGGPPEPTRRDSAWSNSRKASAEWNPEAWKPKAPTASPVFGSSSRDSERSASRPSNSGNSSRSNGGDGGWSSTGWGAPAVSTSEGNTGWGTATGWGQSTDAGSSGAGGEQESGGGWGTGTWADSDGDWPWGDPSIDPKSVSTSAPTSRPATLRLNIDDTAMPNTTPVPPSSTSSYRAASQAPSERTVCATPQSAFPHFSVPQPALPKNMSRSQIHSGIIRNSVRVTRIRLESMKLQRELARWKTTQLSPQFHRVSPIAGNRLNSIAHDLTNQLKAVNLRLKQAENELLQFPNLPSSVPNLMNSRKVEKEMMAYTVELTAWFQSFTTFATLESKPAPTLPSSDFSAMDTDPEQPARDNSSLGIKRRLEELEDILEEVEQKFHPAETFSRQRNAEYIERAIETLPTGELNGRSLATEKGVADQSPNTLDGAAEKLSGKFGSLAEQVVTLIQANADGKRQIDLLTAQREQHHHMKVQMESQFERLEKAQQDRRKLLDLMTAELTQLASAPQPQATAQVDEAVLTHVKSIVETIIETQVVPALEALNKQYTGIVEQRMKELHRTIQPALDATEEICQRAEALAT